MNDIEYRPQRGVGVNALIWACVMTVLAVLASPVGPLGDFAWPVLFPAAAAVACFARYVLARRRRCRLTSTGITSRYLLSRTVAWADIRDIQVFELAKMAACGPGRFS